MTDETSNDSSEETQDVPAEPAKDPVRKWTLIILGLCAVLMVYYVVADRVTPYTTQARVNALVVPIAPEVSGTVTEVAVESNQFVEAGELLLQIDRERYELAVETAQPAGCPAGHRCVDGEYRCGAGTGRLGES